MAAAVDVVADAFRFPPVEGGGPALAVPALLLLLLVLSNSQACAMRVEDFLVK